MHRLRLHALTLGAALICLGCDRSPELRIPPTAPTPPGTVGLACGIERWAVKTLSDPDAASLNMTQITTTTISALNAVPAHCRNLPEERTFPEEFRLFEITGRVTLVRLEEDRDYHIAVVDPLATNNSMITESVDPQCQGAVSSPHLDLLKSARDMLNSVSGGRPTSLTGQTVRIQGVGFFDFDHGQTGRSRSCIELHPILRIERVGT